jgi:predicted lipid-binding transport protein (Tim44 family)
VTDRAINGRWTPVALGLLVSAAGFVVAGLIGALAGLLAGLAAARTPRGVFLAAAVALFVTAWLTILEGPLTVNEIPAFPNNHPAANIGGAIAGVLLLAGMSGILSFPHRSRPPKVTAAPPTAKERRSTFFAVLAATLLGALALGYLGDRRWEGLAFALDVAVLILAVCLVVAVRRMRRPATDRS